MTTILNANGRARKSLSEQIDRLDGILDGLAEGLWDAVADAVKQAVGLAVEAAVRGVLTEVLSNPSFLDQLRASLGVTTAAVPVTVVPAAPVRQSSRVAACLTRARAWLGIGWCSVRHACASVAGGVTKALSAAKRPWQMARQFRTALLVALGVGIVVGIVAYSGGPFIAAVTGWIAGFVTTLATQAGIWWRRTFTALESSTTSPATAW
jgi:hypothetical protein